MFTLIEKRPFSISNEDHSIRLGDGIFLEWRNSKVRDLLSPVIEDKDGITAVVVTVPQSNEAKDWIRLCVEGKQRGNMLGVRILFHISEEDAAKAPQVSLMLANSNLSERYRTSVPQTTAAHVLNTAGWKEISGLFVCAQAAENDRLDVLINLPKNCTLKIAAVETHWHDAVLSAQVKSDVATRGAVVLDPFTITRRTDGDMQTLLNSAPVFRKKLGFSGAMADGFVLSAPSLPHVSVTSDSGSRDLTLDKDAEISPGVSVACGFSAAIEDIVDADTTDLTFAQPMPNGRVLDSVRVPGEIRRSRLMHSGQLPTRQSDPYNTPMRLFFFPDYRVTNPYQTMMYRSMPNVVSSPGTLAEAIRWMEEEDGPEVTIMHLHWLHPVLANAKTDKQAEQQRDQFVKNLEYFTHLGGIVLWTVHNVVSHGAKFPETERLLGQDVANLAAKVHVHSKRLLPILAQYYDILPQKLLVQAHPNFLETYPNYVTRDAARKKLDLPDTAKVILFQGQIRPYKGIDTLVRAFTKIRKTDPDAHLVISGSPVSPYYPGMVSQKYRDIENLHIVEGHIADAHLQWFYNAADWVVLPYSNILTSGSLLCAMSFSRPVIAPDLGMIADHLKDGTTGVIYDPDAPDALYKALQRALATPPATRSTMEQNALREVMPLTWEAMGSALENGCQEDLQATYASIPFEHAVLDTHLMGPPFPPAKVARTAVIILNYQNDDDVQRLIDTLKQQDNRDFDIYVVDNASPNLWKQTLEAAFPDTYVLRIPENVGYAAGNNAAMRLIRHLPYEFYWIINPDMEVSPQALDQHIKAAEAHKDISLFGPAIARGANHNLVASAGGYVSFNEGVSTGHMYDGETFDVLPDAPFEADFVTGASVFLRSSVIEDIGYIPEEYFLYFEETHWLLEAKKRGFPCLVLPHIHLAHYKRSEGNGLPEKYYFFYYVRNYLLFFNKMTGKNPEEALHKLHSAFVDPWLKKIAARMPSQLAVFQRISEQAIADGLAGISGKFDLVTLELSPEDIYPTLEPDQLKTNLAVSQTGAISGDVIAQTPIEKCILHVIVDGKVALRHDCPQSGTSGKPQIWHCSAALPPAYRKSRQSRIELRINGAVVQGGEQIRYLDAAQPEYHGRIDGISNYSLSGWAWNKNNPEEPLGIEVLHEGVVIAFGMADNYREDLRKNGISNGRAAFSLRLPKMFSDGQTRSLSLRVADTDIQLNVRNVIDGQIKGGAAPEPLEKTLSTLLFERQLWLSRYEWEDLPIGQFETWTRQALATHHAQTPCTKKVSIIMPAFNRASTIAAAIQSVQDQSFENWELIIADDGSTDGTQELVEALIAQTGDLRLKLIRLPRNMGVSAARNVALEASSGEIIAYLDSDNIWDPDFLNIMTGELSLNPAPFASAYCGQSIVHVQQSVDGPLCEQIGVRMAPFHLALLENRNFIDLNCYVHSRACYEQAGGFNEELRRLVDWELILRYARQSSPHYVPALLSNYYFDNADNQITKVESYSENLKRFTEVAKRQPGAALGTAALRPVDLVIFDQHEQEHETDALAARLMSIMASLPERADVRISFYPDTDKGAHDIAPLLEGIEVREADFDNVAARVHDAMLQRRPGADMVFLQTNALPRTGWLDNFNRALDACPEGGVFIGRQTLPGSRIQKLDEIAPFAMRNHDMCVALKKMENTVLNPSLCPGEDLMEISGFNAFCCYVPGDVLACQEGSKMQAETLEDALKCIAQYARFGLHKKLVYGGRVEILDVPIV